MGTDRPKLRDNKDEPEVKQPEAKADDKAYRRETAGPRVSTLEPADDQDAVIGDDEEDDDTILLDFPANVNLQTGGMMHHFGRGQHRCRKAVVMEKNKRSGKEELHWYLRHSSVRVVPEAPARQRV
jgi:hypothetical protein